MTGDLEEHYHWKGNKIVEYMSLGEKQDEVAAHAIDELERHHLKDIRIERGKILDENQHIAFEFAMDRLEEC